MYYERIPASALLHQLATVNMEQLDIQDPMTEVKADAVLGAIRQARRILDILENAHVRTHGDPATR